MDHTTEGATDAFASALLADMMVGATEGAGDYEVGNEHRHHLSALALHAVEGPQSSSPVRRAAEVVEVVATKVMAVAAEVLIATTQGYGDGAVKVVVVDMTAKVVAAASKVVAEVLPVEGRL